MVGRAWLLALLLLPQVALGAWTQSQGDAARSGVLGLPGGALDVVAGFQFHDGQAQRFGMTRYLETAHGMTALVRGEDGCRLVHVADWQDPAPWDVGVADCQDAHLQAYLPGDDLALLCVVSPDLASAGLRAVRAADGSVAWSVPVAALGFPAVPGAVNALCSDTVVMPERGLMVTAFLVSRTGGDWPQHTLAAIDFHGRIQWQAAVPALAGAAPAPPLDPLPLPSQRTGTGLAPFGLTATDRGIVLVAVRYCHDPVRCDWTYTDNRESGAGFAAFVLSWFDWQGRYVGSASPLQPDPGAMDLRRIDTRSSIAAVGAGPHAAALLGTHVVVVDLASPEALRHVPILVEGRIPDLLGVLPPVWDGKRLVVPLYQGIEAFEGFGGERLWDHREAGDWWLPRVASVGDAHHETLVVYAGGDLDNATFQVGDEPFRHGRLVRLAENGRVLQRLPLGLVDRVVTEPAFGTGLPPPADTIFRYVQGYDLVPWGDGHAMAIDASGHAWILGPARPHAAPLPEADTGFPAVDAPLTLRLPARDDVASYWVAWGDPDVRDAVVEAQAGTLTHTYTSPGRRPIDVTAVFMDGTTATQRVWVDVGGSPVGFVQGLFLPEHQETTWGLIGLAAVAVGAAWGFLQRRRRAGRLLRLLHRIEAVEDDAHRSPEDALVAAEALRRTIRAELEGGRISEDQFQLLARRATAVGRRVQARLVGPMAGRLSASFRRMLDAAFEDGLVTRGEAGLLRDQLARERRLLASDRQSLDRLLAAWGQAA